MYNELRFFNQRKYFLSEHLSNMLNKHYDVLDLFEFENFKSKYLDFILIFFVFF